MGLLSALGGLIGVGANIFNTASTNKAAKEMATHGVTWKARDAMRAYEQTGIHPLVGMGAQPASYSPIPIGDMAGPMSDIGQNLDRAVTATRSAPDRLAAQANMLSLERAGLENDLLRSQIASTNAQLRAQIGPAMPGGQPVIDGQGDSRRLDAMGLTINPDPRDTPAQKWEDEYGEAADVIGAIRLARDADPVVSAYLNREVKKAIQGKPNIFFTARTPLTGKGKLLQWLSRNPNGPRSRPRLYYN